MPSNGLNPILQFPWTAASEKATFLVADGHRTYQSIADEVGVHKDTIRMWLAHPDFKERVRSILETIRAESMEVGIQHKLGRVSAMQDRWQRLKQVIDERAESPEYEGIPGGTTGLLVHRTKIIGSGKSATRVEEYELDTGLLSEMRNLEKHVAQELGQWVEKNETEHSITRVEVVYEDRLPQDL